MGYVNMSHNLLINYIQEITVTHDVVTASNCAWNTVAIILILPGRTLLN